MAVTRLAHWDPDAGGAAAPLVFVEGHFSVVDDTIALDTAIYDPVAATWSFVGPFANLTGVTAQTTLPNGDQVFARGGVVERWDGIAWTPLGTGMNGNVRALAALTNGDVIAGGDFTDAGGVAANHVALWNGSSWSAMGSGTNAPVRDLISGGTSVLVAGAFTTAGGAAANRLAAWDGTWTALGAGTDGDVNAIALVASGDLVLAGSFTMAGGVAAANIASFDGATWAPLGSGLDATVRELLTTPSGPLFARGDFSMAGSTNVDSIAAWDGVAWSALADDGPVPDAFLLLAGGDLLVGGTDGYFPGYGVASDGVALQRWNGTAWSSLGVGIDGEVRALVTLANGDVVAGGDFRQAGATAASRVACWDGATWSPFAGGVDGTVRALATLASGHLVAGGDFVVADGVAASRVARWDGVGWSALGAGTDGAVRALARLPNGDLIAAGDFVTAGAVAANRVARWDGVGWSALGQGMNGPVRALAVLANGDLVAAGDFTTADGAAANRIACWDGVAWSPLDTGFDGSVRSLVVLADGMLVAGGSFTTAGGASALHLAGWDGVAWSSLDHGLPVSNFGVSAVATLPNGELVVGDYDFDILVPGQPFSRLLRWDGESWTQFGAANGQVHAFAAVPSGELAVAGAFTIADGDVSAFFARYVSTCPAAAAPSGVGCPSSGGANLLTANSLPWVDAPFRATATGLPSMAFVLTITGFTPVPQGTLPLSSVFSQAQPGCDLLVDPLFFDAQVANGGSAESLLFLVNSPPLVGVTFYHQMIPIEVDMSLAFVAITATNALELTPGDF